MATLKENTPNARRVVSALPSKAATPPRTPGTPRGVGTPLRLPPAKARTPTVRTPRATPPRSPAASPRTPLAPLTPPQPERRRLVRGRNVLLRHTPLRADTHTQPTAVTAEPLANPEPAIQYDEFGFEVEAAVAGPATPPPRGHEQRWRQILDDWPHWERSYSLHKLLVTEVWPLLARVPTLRARYPPDHYRALLALPDPPEAAQIRLDLDRTFHSHTLFRTPAGRETLFRVLKAYALHDPATGYCQGLGFVAGACLMRASEEAAFWLLAAHLRRTRSYYAPDLGGLVHDTKLLAKMLRLHAPALAAHLDSENVDALLFTGKWFLTLFTELETWRTTLRVWDLVLAGGRRALLHVALALLDAIAPSALAAPFETLVPLLLSPPARATSPRLFAAAAARVNMDSLLAALRAEAGGAAPPPTPRIARAPLPQLIQNVWDAVVSPVAAKSRKRRADAPLPAPSPPKRARSEPAQPHHSPLRPARLAAYCTPQRRPPPRVTVEMAVLSPRRYAPAPALTRSGVSGLSPPDSPQY